MATEEFEEEFEAAECPTCGAIVPADATECTECGQRFEEEDEVWEEDELMGKDEFMSEESEDWGDFWEEEAPGKFKLYFGIFLVLFGSLGMGLMSWLHNQLEWNPLGLENYAPEVYGPYDQMFGGSGTVVTLIGIVLIFLWMRAAKRYRQSLEQPKKGDTEYFEDEEEVYEEDYEEEPIEEVQEIACPECGELNPADSTECWICGFPFGEEIEEEPEEEDFLVEEEEPEEDQIRCPNCGTKNEADTEYCANCEHDLSGGTEIWGEE